MAKTAKEQSDYNAKIQAEAKMMKNPQEWLQCPNEKCNRVWKDNPDRQFCFSCGCRGESCAEEVILTGDEAIRAYREGRSLKCMLTDRIVDGLNHLAESKDLHKIILGNYRWKVMGIQTRRELKW